MVGIVLGALVVMGLLRHRRRKRAAAAAEDEAKMNDDSMASHWFPTSHSKELGAWRDAAEVYGSTKGASSPETMMYPYTGSGGVTPWGPIEMADPAAADGGVYDGGMVPGFVEAPAQVALKMGAGGWDYAPKEMLPMSVMGMAAPNMQQVHYMQTEVDGGLLEKGAMPLQDMKSKVYPLPGLDEAGGYPSPPASMPASALPPNSAGSMPEQGEEVPAEVHQLPVPEDSWPVESHKFRFPPP